MRTGPWARAQDRLDSVAAVGASPNSLSSPARRLFQSRSAQFRRRLVRSSASVATSRAVGERQRLGVHAVAQSRRPRPVVEDVPEVAVAAGAEDLDPPHAVAAVLFGDDVLVGDRLEEARPAGAGIELRVRGEERQTAADAGVDALPLVVEERAAERPLGALAARDLELLAGQQLAPLGVGLLDARQSRSARRDCLLSKTSRER